LNASEDSLLSELKKKIPGYGAYRAQESRRDDDRSTRQFLAKRLQDCKTILDKRGAHAVAEGNLDAPLAIERLRNQLDLAQTRLSAAIEGYAGWFNERKVDASLLEQVAKLDEGLVSLVDQINAMLDSDVSPLHSPELQEAIGLLHKRIDRRGALLKEGI
jgi:hypothetical protein